jgi:hypothetical protein
MDAVLALAGLSKKGFLPSFLSVCVCVCVCFRDTSYILPVN